MRHALLGMESYTGGLPYFSTIKHNFKILKSNEPPHIISESKESLLYSTIKKIEDEVDHVKTGCKWNSYEIKNNFDE